MRKLGSRRKQGELAVWLEGQPHIKMLGVSETGLQEGEYIDTIRGFRTVEGCAQGCGRKGGGVAVLLKTEAVEEEIVMDERNCVLLKVRETGKTCWEWLFGVVYFEVEGRDRNENLAKLIVEKVSEAKLHGLKVILGGDFNGHLFQLDGCSNSNGNIANNLKNRAGLKILNADFPGLAEPTWRRGDTQFTLDLIMADERAIADIRTAEHLDWEEGADSDHRVLIVELEGHKRGVKRDAGVSRRNENWIRRPTEEELGEVEDQVEQDGAVMKRLTEIIRMVGDPEDRGDGFSKGGRERVETGNTGALGWLDSEVKEAIKRRKIASRMHRREAKRLGRDAPEVLALWGVYKEEKKEAAKLVSRKIHIYNQAILARINGPGREADMWQHIRSLLRKGRTGGEGSISVINSTGDLICDEAGIREEIESFWGTLLTTEGTATHEGRYTGGGEWGSGALGRFGEKELGEGLRRLKRGKATGEDGIPGEWYKGLGERGKDKLLGEFNAVLCGEAQVPEEWKISRISLLHKGGSRRVVSNYRPVAIISAECKLFCSLVSARMRDLVEGGHLLGDLQGGFRKGKQTQDNLLILARVAEVLKAQGRELLLGFLDLEKAFDRVDRRRLFEALRRYGFGPWVPVLEEIYSHNEVIFSFRGIRTARCQNTSGVRQGCPLSPLLFNLYMREVGIRIEECGCGVDLGYEVGGDRKKLMLGGLLYADDVCLLAEREEDMERLLGVMAELGTELGLRFSGRKSAMVRMTNDERSEREWKLGELSVKEVPQYKYLGLTVRGGSELQVGSVKDRISESRSAIAAIKYAARRSGSRLLVGRAGWKGLVVPKLMYGAGVCAWGRKEVRDLDKVQMEIARFLWRTGKGITNRGLRGETGLSTFGEREAKAKTAVLSRIVFEDSLMSKVGRWSLKEIGGRSRWWRRVTHIAKEYGLREVTGLFELRCATVRALASVCGRQPESEKWRGELKALVEREGRQKWMREKRASEEPGLYREKEAPAFEAYADDSMGARVRMMLRCGALPVGAAKCQEWKGEAQVCHCCGGSPETVDHLFLHCEAVEEDRKTVKGLWEGRDPWRILLGLGIGEKEWDGTVKAFLGRVWEKRQSCRRQRGVEEPNGS